MSYIFYYLTEDSGNPKERNEVNYLRLIGRVVVVTRGDTTNGNYGNDIKRLNLPSQSRLVVSAYSMWTKLCYLLCRPSNSLTDKEFPTRNVYTGNLLVRWFINHLWPVKYWKFINRLLPVYETLYFAPFKLARLFVRDKHRLGKRLKRIVVHDALILRITRFTSYILMARRSGMFTLANVKSWDNPFYTQFARGASGYLTWSQSMWSDVQRFHQVSTLACHTWGPRPFYNFAHAVRCTPYKPNTEYGTVVIGYAAAFCDPLMAAHEVKVLAGIAEHLRASGLDLKILFRPYPIVPMSSYEPLEKYSNIEIVDIKGTPTDRYGDGREIIRFGSDEERIQYLSRCHCFLSIATSFTFEAALFGMPVIQYFVPKNERVNKHESAFFGRLDISDHILNYFLPHLSVVKSSTSIIELIKSFKTNPSMRKPPLEMMSVIGLPFKEIDWNVKAAHLVTDLHLT